MTFREPFVVPSKRPIICYVNAELPHEDIRDKDAAIKLISRWASKWLKDTEDKDDTDVNGVLYYIGFLEVLEFQRFPALMLHLWGFGGLQKWSESPYVTGDVISGGSKVEDIGSEKEALDCLSGDALIIFGLEEQLRRSCKSLPEYIGGSRPKLPDYFITPWEE